MAATTFPTRPVALDRTGTLLEPKPTLKTGLPAGGGADPAVVEWLNTVAGGAVRPGSRAIVVGCGAGAEVAELRNRGYDAIGFDICPTAVQQARTHYADQTEAFICADLFKLPTRWRHRFELVVDVGTLASIEPSQRLDAALSLATLCGPRGVVLIITNDPDDNLAGLLEKAGLRPRAEIERLGGVCRGVFERV